MPKITFEQADGSAAEVDARSGESLMEAAIDNDVAGIIAECGGACSCATCHVYVDPAWADRLPPPEPLEDGMLDCVLDRQPTSRLSCQIRVDDSLEGMRVRVPTEQL
jgi:2Fe-2S ferredoxin